MQKIWEGLREASKQPGAVFRENGNVDQALCSAAKTVKATYQLPFLSHSPMEPQNTTAHVTADKAVIITPTQFQQLIPHVVAGATGLKPEQVRGARPPIWAAASAVAWKWTTPSTPRRSPRLRAACR